METSRHPRLLIVGTVPYNTKSTSRAFDSYFHYWEKENLAQIFSDPKTPVKGHCGTLFQITDARLLQCWKGRKVETGKVYRYDDLPDSNESSAIVDDRKKAEKMYRYGSRHSAFTHLLRGLLWRKKLWCTPGLLKWLDDFSPECVFLSFSDDYFIPRIAYFVARRYNIPIVSSIGDDYYFNVRFSLNPLYWLYKLSYRSLIRKVLSYRGSANYISDKIRDKYNAAFGIDGETVYLSSDIKRKPFAPVDVKSPLITYFGKIRMGRNRSLNDIGYALGKIDPSYVLEIYSGERNPEYYGIFKDNPNVKYGGSIPYEAVQEKMANSDVTVIVEGFEDKDIDCSRYSLSTKAADALASGATILAYGSAECGIIDYMQGTHASFVCTDKGKLEQTLREMFASPSLQEEYYKNQIILTEEHHNLRKSCEVFEGIVQRALSK
ncbi:MAG: hypothetical protein IKX67_01895 [Bacteroidales bacterium]|nr:hypothetical protein [Bacteroidales bacterium]